MACRTAVRLIVLLAGLVLTSAHALADVVAPFAGRDQPRDRPRRRLVPQRADWPCETRGTVRQLADLASQQWRAAPTGAAFVGTYVPITHPTQPESSAKGE
jgi:hypothetical protein